MGELIEMARIRSVHPGLATDARFVVLSDAAQIFFVLLLTVADDAGVFRWQPLELQMQVRPASPVSVEPLLDELVAGNFLCRFEAGGNAYGAIRNFCRFQSPKSPTRRHPLPENLFAYVGAEPDSAPVSEAAMTPAERARRYRARHGTVTETVTNGRDGVTQRFVTPPVTASRNAKCKDMQNQLDTTQFPNLFRTPSEDIPQSYPLERDKERERDKEMERESLVERTSLLPREAEPHPQTRPSPKILKKVKESEAEPRPTPSEIPEGWLAEAEAARDEAGLEPVNLTLEWLKFAMRADGEIELRRWLEWSLRAWVSREPKAKAGGAPSPVAVAETPWAARMRHWRDEGFWLPMFGPKPGQPGCFVPPEFLAEAAE